MKVAQSCPTLCNPMDYRAHFPGQNTGLGSLSILQEIFPIQGSSPGLPHCRRTFYQLSHKGSPQGSGGGEYKGNLSTFHLIFTVNLKLLLKIKSVFFFKCLSLTLPLMEDVGRGSSFWADRIRHSSAPSVCMGRGEPSGSRRAGV